MFRLLTLLSDNVKTTTFTTTSTPTTTSTSIVPKSPTKNGIMREDKHWLLKTPRCPPFDHPYEPHIVCHALASDKVTFDVWRRAPGVAEWLDEHDGPDRWVGRRVNDEVELFFEDGNEEYEILKQCLEEHRFTVRPYISQSEKNKRPKVTYETALGGGTNTLMSKIRGNLALQFEEEIEEEEDCKIEYGLIMDLPAPTKSLCVGKVDRETFRAKQGLKEATIAAGDAYVQINGKRQEWKILGEVKRGKIKFWCDDEVTKQYFDSLGRIEQLDWVDYVDEKEHAEKEARQKEKKVAKKHRRKVTESTTITTPSSEMSFGSRFTEVDEAVKARQRAKQNEKRKRQQQRRKEGAEEVRKPSYTLMTMTLESDSEDTKSSSSNSDQRDLLHKLFGDAAGKDTAMINRMRSRPFQKQVTLESDEDSDGKDRKPKVKLPKAEYQQTRKDSVKDVEEIKNEAGVDEVVRMTTKEDHGKTVEELQALNFKYLGRGL